jgi:cyclohexanone monooxygenase
VRGALDRGFCAVEARADAEEAWMELLRSGPGSIIGSPDCTPGYYNNEGQDPGPQGNWLGQGYPEGASAYFEFIERWRTSGEFEGLEFRPG